MLVRNLLRCVGYKYVFAWLSHFFFDVELIVKRENVKKKKIGSQSYPTVSA